MRWLLSAASTLNAIFPASLVVAFMPVLMSGFMHLIFVNEYDTIALSVLMFIWLSHVTFGWSPSSKLTTLLSHCTRFMLLYPADVPLVAGGAKVMLSVFEAFTNVLLLPKYSTTCI